MGDNKREIEDNNQWLLGMPSGYTPAYKTVCMVAHKELILAEKKENDSLRVSLK